MSLKGDDLRDAEGCAAELIAVLSARVPTRHKVIAFFHDGALDAVLRNYA